MVSITFVVLLNCCCEIPELTTNIVPCMRQSQTLPLDAKRDLSDLGLKTYAEENCFLLGKLPYENLSKKYPEGVMFATYQTLIGKNKGEKTRLDQLIQWCGEDFDGLIM